MPLSKLKAVLGLVATADGTRQGVTWDPRVGREPAEFTFPAALADSLYQVQLSGITDTVTPELELAGGTVTANGATVSGAGTDFQGYPLSAMGRIFAIFFERLDSHASIMSITADGVDPDTWYLGPGERVLHLTTSETAYGIGRSLETDRTLTFAAGSGANAQVRVTVLASIG